MGQGTGKLLLIRKRTFITLPCVQLPVLLDVPRQRGRLHMATPKGMMTERCVESR